MTQEQALPDDVEATTAQAKEHPFEAEVWAQLPDFFTHLPQPVRLVMWGDEAGSQGERETAVLCRALAAHFETIRFEIQPRRENYPYYPVLGVMGDWQTPYQDFGVRIIGWPAGFQFSTLITAVQAVAFQGSTLEPVSRIKLHKLSQEVGIELVTAAENEGGPMLAKVIFGMAVAIPKIRAYVIMADSFPEVVDRYSIAILPHTIMNGRIHISGFADEAVLVQHVLKAAQ